MNSQPELMLFIAIQSSSRNQKSIRIGVVIDGRVLRVLKDLHSRLKLSSEDALRTKHSNWTFERLSLLVEFVEEVCQKPPDYRQQPC